MATTLIGILIVTIVVMIPIAIVAAIMWGNGNGS
jgi:hypothetical protein